MFGKIAKQQVHHHFNKANDFLGNAYNKTKSFLGTVDSGINNIKTIYIVVSPIMESYGVNPANKSVMKALTEYDTIKSHVMENHDRVFNDINRVRSDLGKKNIKFDFT